MLLPQAAAIAATTGANLLCETFPARLERGAGRVSVGRLAYLAEFAAMQLEGLRHIVLIDAKAPVSFFAYPGKASDLVPEGCRVHTLAAPDGDISTALAMLAERVGATAAAVHPAAAPALPTGALTADSVCAALGALMPENAIISDEGNTSGLSAAGHTSGSPPHDWLCLTGGAIGQGLPVAVGAAVACPDRRVIALESDGSALYTMQSWWTMARESLNVITILLNNRSYAILNMELDRVGAEVGGPRAKDMLDLSRPDIDFTAIAKGLGLHSTRATTAHEFVDQLGRALVTPGPAVIEAMVPSIL
jgi:acetolactate synthase-1/2/3 large subunit